VRFNQKAPKYLQTDFWNEAMKIISNIKVHVYTFSESFRVENTWKYWYKMWKYFRKNASMRQRI